VVLANYDRPRSWRTGRPGPARSCGRPVLIHFMREGDRGMPVSDLVRKCPYARAAVVVRAGWE